MPQAEYMPFVNIDWTLVFTWINLLILYFIVKKFLYKPVKKMIESRESEVQKIYDTAETVQNEAESLKQEYFSRIDNAKEEAGEIVKLAYKNANARSDEILSEAQLKAARIVEKADEDIARERTKAANQIKDDVADIALMIAEKVVGREISVADHERLIENFLDNAGDASWQK